jgi:NAD(P)-dependent dehydrogenase (short-subunit alcohol dehydrogenase family)
MPSLKDKTVLVIGRGGGIARAIALAVSDDGGSGHRSQPSPR